MFPALDLAGFKRRSILPTDYIDRVETITPGFTDSRIAVITSRIYAQLRKRYGNNSQASGLPFGKAPAPFDAAGTSPPAIALVGVPTLGSIELVIQVTSPGPLGTAIVQWSSDGGRVWNTGLVSAATAVLAGTGITASFGAGAYSVDNTYRAATPVPEVILGWITAILNCDMLAKHRVTNVTELQLQRLDDDRKQALTEIEQAASSKDGLFDLPPADAESDASAVTTGGMISYSETGSPFVSADRQERDAAAEDQCGMGTFSGAPFGSWP